jgi:hypothetical protein
MQTYNPSRAIGYQGIAYAACANYDLGNNASLGNHSFEMSGVGTLQNGFDVNVVDVISDYLGNANYGAMFPFIGDTAAARDYCQANGLFISPVLNTQKPAHEWLTQFAKIANAGLVWSGGLLKLIPYGDQAAAGNGVTYTPNPVTPIYDLTDDDFQDIGGDPITVTRKRQADAFNAVQVEFLNRNNQYNLEPADVKDQANIEAYGLRSMSPVTLHEVCVPTVAKQVAQALLQRELYIRNTYSFALSWKYCLLEPMDVVSLTDDALGLNRTPVRIVTIEESYDGLLSVIAEEMPYGVSQPALYSHTGGSGYQANNNIDPGAVNAPVIFEPPNVMTAPNLEVWFGVSGGVNWGGCDVWVSEDNATYRNIGKIFSPARQGVLSAALAGGVDPDTTHTLSVDLTESRSQLLSGTQADADNLNTLMWVDGELMSYQTAALTSQYHYDLSYLRRGVHGTVIGAHGTGAQMVRLDDAIFKYVVPRESIGLPVWVKFASFNAFGRASQSLADCVAYNYTIAGNRPMGVSALTGTGGMFLNDLAWTFAAVQRDRDYTEIIGSTTNDRATALTLTAAKSPTARWKHPGLTPTQTWYYWARTVDNSGNASDWYPVNATGGMACAPSADPSALMSQLANSIDVAQLSPNLGNNFLAGNVNGAATVGLNGNMVIDGSIVGRSVAAKSLTADQINGANLSVSGSLSGADITGATGTFGGALLAGTVDITKLIGTTTNYLTPGTYTLTVPADKTSMRVTLVGGGGTGGNGLVGWGSFGSGSGAGSGYLVIGTFSGLTPGATYTLIVGGPGQATLITGLLTANAGSNGATFNGSTPTIYGLVPGGSGYRTGGTGSGMVWDTGVEIPATKGGGTGGGAPGASGVNGSGGAGGAEGYLSGVSASPGGNSVYGGYAVSYGGRGGVGYGAGGGGGANGFTYGNTGGQGAQGMATIEFFNPNGVVIRNEWNNLLSALARQGIASV